MSRPAAGGPADGPDRRGPRRTALLAVLLVAGALLLATGTALVPARNARAAPSSPSSSTSGTDSADRPVRIDVTQFDPRTVTPNSVLTLRGSLTNTGSATISQLGLRLQRGAAYADRAALVAGDRDPDPDTTVVPPFQELPGDLPPGHSASFSYTLPAAALQLTAAGVYSALLNVNGTIAGAERRVGQLSTYLIVPPTTPTARTTVAWLWPLTDRSHRDAAGHFTDDELAREIGSNGRLDRALSVLEQLPRATPPGGTAAVPTVPVTLAIDPALVEELQAMAAGPYQVQGRPGSGTPAAAAFLQRLRALAAVLPVVALPYGDVDAESLQAVGLSQVVVRSLPGTAAGTAHDDRLRSPAPGTTTSAAPSAPPAGGGDAVNQPAGTTGAGAAILTAALGVKPRTDLAWLPSGAVHAATLTTLAQHGVDEVVLPAAALSGGDAELGIGRPQATVRTAVPVGAGSLATLVSDTQLGGLSDSGRVAGGTRVAEQRYLAELTLLSTQAPATAAPTVLVSPPRLVDANPDGVAAMMTDTTQLPWLQAGSLDGVAGTPAADAGALAPPPATPALDATGLADVAAAVSVRDALAGAVAQNPDAALAADDAAISRASSVEWRGDPTAFRARAKDLRATMSRLADQVALVVPADGTYSLGSTDAPLVLTVRNDLPFAVQVLLRLRTPTPGFQLGNIGEQTLAPGQRTTLQVPTQAHRSGGFTVTAALTTPDGSPLGAPVTIRVKTTAYGSIGVIITIGAGALLGLLFLRRLVRFLLRRRHATPGGDLPGPPAEGAAVPLPPTRSPV